MRAVAFLLLLAIVLAGPKPLPAAEPSGPALIIYPEAREPYRRLFAEIVDGAAAALEPHPVHEIAVTEPERGEEKARLADTLANVDSPYLIALGRAGLAAVEGAGVLPRTVIGALDLDPRTHPQVTGVSLSPDPEVLFSALKRLSPNTENVHVVYDPQTDGWTVDLASRAATGLGLTLIAHDAKDLTSAASAVTRVLGEANPETDSLWLTLNRRLIDDDVLLPKIIETAWRKRLPVFSSSLRHVDKGVLFGTYPDTVRLGERLAELAVTHSPSSPQTIYPLTALKLAINIRLASHLGLHPSPRVLAEFDLVVGKR